MADSFSDPQLNKLLDRGFRRLLYDTPLYVWVTDAQGRTVWVSPSWIKFSGRDAGEDYLESWSSRVWPDDLPQASEHLRIAFERRTGLRFEYRIRRADGEWRWILCTGVPYTDASGEYAGFAGTNYDFTELRRMEERAQLLSDQQRAIFDQLTASIFVVDADERYRFVNRAWERYYNLARGEVVGHTIGEFFPPDIVQDMRHENDEVLSRPGWLSEREVELPTMQGSMDFLVQKLRIMDADGVTPLVCGVSTDLTHVRHAEEHRRKFEQRLEHGRRQESLGVMAGGIAHDFNNLLLVVLGNTDMALMDLPEDSPVREYLRQIEHAGSLAAELAGKMLAYAGRLPTGRAMLDLPEMFNEVRESVLPRLTRNVILYSAVDDGLPAVAGDAERLCQALVHLVENSADAIGESAGEIRLRASAVEMSREALDACEMGESLSPGRYLVITVADTGSGMDEAARARAFEPFFSTRFSGRGLGLSVVRGVVRAHQGAVGIVSAPGAGTSVGVVLPLA